MLAAVVGGAYRLGTARPPGPLGPRCVAQDGHTHGEFLLTTLRIDLSRLTDADRELLLAAVRRDATYYHPHLARQHAAGIEARARLWVVQDLPTGEVLPAGRALAPGRAAALVAHVAEAVGYLHGAGTYHGAVCRENLFVDAVGTPVLVDLGLGRAADMCGSLGRLLGPLAAPEVRQQREAGPASDVYGLGALLLALLLGREPPAGAHTDVVAAQALAEVCATIESPALWTVLERALAADPARRFSSALAMVAPLREAAEELQPLPPVVPAGAVASAEAAGSPSAAGSAREAAGAEARRAAEPPPPISLARGVTLSVWVVLRSLLTLALALCLVAAAIGAGFTLAFREGPAEVQVPDLGGLTVSEAEQVAAARGLKLRVQSRPGDSTAPANTVLRTSPYAGKWVRQGRTVDAIVSAGRQGVPVPRVVGLDQEEARRELEAAGLAVGLVKENEDSSEPEGQVLSQRPEEAAVLPGGSKVDLVVSAGPSRAVRGDRRRYAATVTVSLPFDSPSRQVRIEVVPLRGAPEVVYQADHFGGDRIERDVEHQGPALVKVYVDGEEYYSRPLTLAETEQD